MTLTQLKYVDAVNRYKSFTKAAKALHVSQPTISTMIRDLEAELQIEIFHREKKGLLLTAEGKLLLQHIAVMLDQETRIQDQFSASRPAGHDSFRVSSQHFPLVSTAFCDFVKERSADNYEYHLSITATTSILNDVSQGTSEIGILAVNELNSNRLIHILEGDNICFHPFLSTEAKVFLSSIHPLAGKKSLTMADLEPWPCFYYDQNDDVLPCFAEEIQLPEHQPQKRIYISDQLSALELFAKLKAYNIGTGIVPHVEVPSVPVIAIPLEGYPTITIGWISKNKPLSPAASRFIELLENRLRNYVF